MQVWLRALFVLLSLVLIGPSPRADAQESRAVHWEQFDVAIDLVPDGTLRVVHTERIRFNGTYQRAFREIPLDRVSSITEVVVGEVGQPAYQPGYNQTGRYAVTRSDNLLRIDWWFPPTTNASRTFQISYRVSGAIRVYPDGDQLWWVAVPADRPGPVESSTVMVRLPQSVPPDQLRAEAYLGRESRPAESVAEQEIRFAAGGLEPGRAFEVRAQFPHGLVAASAPSWQPGFDRERWYDPAVRPVLNLLLLLATLGLLVSGGLFLFFRWYRGGRDPAADRVPAELDAPPGNLPPGLAGTVVDEHADVQDVIATLVDLANRGVIRITQQRNPRLQGSDLDYRLELLQERPLGLRSFEKTVIGALFGAGEKVRLSNVKGRWSGNMPLFHDQLYAEAVSRGLFVDHPDAVRRRWRNGAVALLVGAVAGGLLLQMMLGAVADLIWLPFAALALIGIGMYYLSRHMPQRTRAGALEAARWKAYARHLATAGQRESARDEDALRKELPYAIALGVDRSWLENFARVGTPVRRFRGGNGPVVIMGPGGWGYPGPYGPPSDGGSWSGGSTGGGGEGSESSSGAGGFPGWNGGFAGGANSANESLMDLLNAANEALSSGGGGGWSGGGGGFGGGSGGGSAGFD